MVIAMHEVTRTYAMGDVQVHALRGVSLRIDRGEFVAIMGASGSGKSTLMNIVGCLDTPTSGSYSLLDRQVGSYDRAALASMRNRHIGFVFQSFNLIPRTTALENVELPAHYLRPEPGGRGGGVPSAAEARRCALAALERVGLSSRVGHLPNQLSGGQQQRVAIARALVNDPELLLADEPTGALDSRTSIEVMALFQELNAQGKTIVLVTHEHDIAQHAGRRIVMRDGRIVLDEAVAAPRRAAKELARLPQEETWN